MLQLVYGNDGVNYKALAKSEKLSDSQYTELKRSYLGYQPVQNLEPYREAGQEPIAYSMAVTDLAGKLPEKNLLLSKKAKMCQMETPSYYAHLCLLDIEEDMFRKDFTSLFEYGFIREEEISEYKDGSIDKFMRKCDYTIDRMSLRDDQIKAALYLLYYNMGSWTDKVLIIIDEDGERYNRRALEIIAGIYNYVPWSLRRMVGFTTYSTPDIKEAAEIRIKIMPRCYLGECGKGELLDFCEENLLDSAAVKKVPDDIKKFVDMLWEAKEGAEGCFCEWWDIFGNAGTLKEHLDYCNKVEIWKKGDLWKHLDEIIDYALDEENQKSKMYRIFKESFGNRAAKKDTVRAFNELLRRKIAGVSDFDGFLRILDKHVFFRKVFPKIKIYSGNLTEWFEKKMLQEAISYEDEKLCLAKLSELRGKLDCLQWKRDLAKVKGQWGMLIGQEENTLRKEMEKKQKMEQEEIEVFFQDVYDDPNADSITKRYQEIRYKEENQGVFREKLYRFLKSGIRQQEEEFTERDYIQGREMIKACEEALGETYYSELAQRQKDLSDRYSEMEARMTVRLNSRGDLGKYYTNREYLRLMINREGEVEYNLIIGDGDPIRLPEGQMDGVADFLLNGTKENWERVEPVFQNNKELLAELQKEGLLHSKDKNVVKMIKKFQQNGKMRIIRLGKKKSD